MRFPSRFLPFPKILDICLLAALTASVSAQTVTVFSARASFEAAMGDFKITDDFSLNGTFLNVISVNGAAGGQQYADIARDLRRLRLTHSTERHQSQPAHVRRHGKGLQ